ncbi:MAG: type IV secretory system conjugative DNA transfer family protein [Streptosporangiaceae bacterium]|nr:type IV secretory system conjugative DNA transfer family protein [Streptosporangiaceae bacterium]
MSRALGPRASATAAASVPWTVLACCWSAVGLAMLGWAGARVAAWFSGGTTARSWWMFFKDVLAGRTTQAWPHTPTPLVAVCVAAVYLLAVGSGVAAWVIIQRRRPVPGDPVAALGDNPAITALTRSPVAQRATRLRPCLTGTNPRIEDIGLSLGRLMRQAGTGPEVFASWEDTLVACMAPRSGKTTVLAIPFVLSAPGAVIATSNKADLWAATATIRADQGSQVWLFDPQRITHQPQKWWWNPLAGLHTVEEADRLAGHFVLTVADDKKRDLWGPAAQDLLAALFLAAATSGGSLHDVGQWLAEPAVPTPIELLTKAGFAAMAVSLRGAQNGAVETRDGIYQTARTAARCLTDPDITAWVTPPRDRRLPSFSPDEFAASQDTLYLLSKSRSAAAPLIAALSDTAMRAAERRAERMGGRLDPPLAAVLDEAANICRIADLPDLYSHLGSRGITPVTILQSYEQGIGVWGEHGMAALWGAATIKIIGAGVDSPRLTRDLATLVGQHDVPVRSVSYSDGRASEQVSLRRQDILEPAAIRALPPGTALLLATGIKPALIRLTPWYAGPRSAEITECRDHAERAIRQAATAAARQWLEAS